MDYRKKLDAAAVLDRMAPGSRLARTVADGAVCDALAAGVPLAELPEAFMAKSIEILPRDAAGPGGNAYAAGAIVPADGWEWARCA